MKLTESQLKNLIKQTISENTDGRVLADSVVQWAEKAAKELVSLKRATWSDPKISHAESDKILRALRNVESALDELVTL